MVCWKEVMDIFGALLTPVIAIIATYIAYQQWNTNRQKLVLDKYDRRLKIYGHVIKVIVLVQRDADIKTEDLLNYRASVAEADFLFGNEIMEYIESVFDRGNKLRLCNQQYEANREIPKPEYDHEKTTNDMHAELTWFSAQYDEAKKLFKNYLDISK